MNWRQLLPKMKAERALLQKQANKIDAKLYCLDKEIFAAEQGIKKMDERRSKGLKSWAKVGCVNCPNVPPINSEEK